MYLDITNSSVKYCDKADERSLLIFGNLRLVSYIAKRFYNSGIEMDDLISIGTIGLIKAVDTFDAGRMLKLSTYASKCIENEILMCLRRRKTGVIEISIDNPIAADSKGNTLVIADLIPSDDRPIFEKIEHEEEIYMLKKALARLQTRDRRIISMRFGIGEENDIEKSQKEIAEALGISQSYVSRREKKILQALKNEMISF